MTPVTDLVIMHNPEQEYKIAWLIPFFYTLLGYFIALIILAYPLPILGAENFTEDFWYTFVFKISGFLLLPIVLLAKSGYRIGDIFYKFQINTRTALTLILAFMVGFSVNMIGRKGREIFIVLHQTNLSKAIVLLILAVLLAYLAAGIPEELIFRWFVMSRLESKHHWVIALFLSSLFFTMWHLPTRLLLAHGAEGEAGDFYSVLMNTGLPVFLTSCILGLFWKYKRSLPHLMIAHGAIDIIPIYASLLGIHI